MKTITLIFILQVLSFSAISQSGTYEFINEIMESDIDTVHLIEEFNTLFPSPEYGKYFSKEGIKELWGPDLKTGKEWPSLQFFLDHVNLEHFVAKADLEFANRFPNNIDFEKLHGNFKKTSIHKLEKGYPTKSYIHISRPFFSCDGKWAMISITSLISGGSGAETVFIYHQKEGKWVLYHKLPLYLT